MKVKITECVAANTNEGWDNKFMNIDHKWGWDNYIVMLTINEGWEKTYSMNKKSFF